jgi:hypothetical protein
LLRLALLIAVLSSGCVVHSLLGGSTTVPKGDFEAAAQGGLSRDQLMFAVDDNQITIEAAFRRGFTERFDLGLKVYGSGAALEGRFQIFRSDGGAKVNALVALTGGVGGAGPNTRSNHLVPLAFGALTVVTGIHLLDELELVFAPTATVEHSGDLILAPPNFMSVQGPLVGVGGSFALVVHLPSGWRVAPEVTVLSMVFPERLEFLVRPHFGLGVYKQF